MKTYIRYDSSNRVVGFSESPEEPQPFEDYQYIEYTGGLDADRLVLGDTIYVVENGVPVDTGAARLAPGEGYFWDAATNNWADGRSLNDKKDLQWEVIKTARDAEEFGELVFQGNVYDIDEVSQRRIQGAVQIAGLDPAIQLEWTTADNAAVLLDATDLQNLGVALAIHVDAAHSKARQLRALIDSATTEGEVHAVTWNSL